jgi:hypothetical protein
MIHGMAQHACFRRVAIVVAIAGSCIVSAQTPGDALLKGFQDPPNSARPRVWWHWMNGNVTKDGIRKDMEWMKRVGIGGLQNFDAALNTPQIVQNRLAYMTPEWKDAFRYAATLADQTGLELTIAASPGWSETGGPWVPPKDGMKKLVWSETIVSGGSRFEGQLAAPPSVTGPFQSMPKSGGIETLMGVEAKAPPTYYADAAVIAYRIPESRDVPVPRLRSSSGQLLDGEAIADKSYATTVEIERGTPDASGFVTLEYDAPQTIRSATVFMPGAVAMFFGASVTPTLEASDDGKTWRKVTDITLSMVPTTVSFAPVTAPRFRLLLNPGASGPPGLGSGAPGVVVGNFGPFGAPPKTVKIADLKLSADARVNQFEAKAGFAVADNYYDLDANVGPEVAGIALDSVVDLTSKAGPDGKLDWTAPAGQWKVIRFGYSLTGTTNHPATAEATGLEVDKYDGTAVRNYLNTYIDMYADTIGRDLMGKRGLRAILTDSIEVGASNWTPALIDQFQRLRGYDPRPWLPALTGVIVSSRRESDAFLYDYRRTLGDLLASEHYGQVAVVAHEHGLQVYGEALESGRPSLGDDIAMRRHADIPMAALWTNPRPSHYADMKGAASVAHVYGQNLVAAESLTSAMQPWSYAPSDLKPYIDLEFAHGINRPVIHTSVHQPVDDKVPGLSLMIFGQHFNRHEAWAEMAKPWVDYIARNAFMLQQGRYFADVAYFFGEEAPLTGLYERDRIADAPSHYAYDFVNPDVVLNRFKVDGNDLVVEGGARYRVLYLGGSSSRMTLPVLRRLASLVEAGATVVGARQNSRPA